MVSSVVDPSMVYILLINFCENIIFILIKKKKMSFKSSAHHTVYRYINTAQFFQNHTQMLCINNEFIYLKSHYRYRQKTKNK